VLIVLSVGKIPQEICPAWHSAVEVVFLLESCLLLLNETVLGVRAVSGEAEGRERSLRRPGIKVRWPTNVGRRELAEVIWCTAKHSVRWTRSTVRSLKPRSHRSKVVASRSVRCKCAEGQRSS